MMAISWEIKPLRNMLAALGGWMFLCCVAVVPTLTLNPLKVITDRIPRLEVDLVKMESCPEHQDLPVQLRDFVLTRKGFNNYSISGKVDTRTTINNPVLLEMEMFRCASRDDRDSCGYYFTYRVTGVCNMTGLMQHYWEVYTADTDLPKHCPIKPKVYSVNTTRFEMKDLQWMPLFEAYWKVKTKSFEQGRLLSCYVSEFNLQKEKKKVF